MSRLQDFPSVTPTSSDNLLVVQSDGQGLASVGSTLGAKMNTANPTGTGSLSMNRASGSTVGANSVAVGNGNIASGESSFAEGRANTASGIRSHAEGSSNTASGDYSHAEGAGSVSSGERSHAEGNGTTASNAGSHAEGRSTIASGDDGSHAEGYNTKAEGRCSHSEGRSTIANHRSQHVFGEFNIADPSSNVTTARGNYVEIVGKGINEENRSNARTLDWNGNETIAGTLTQSSDARLKEVKSDDIPDVSSIKAVRFTWRKGTGRDFDEHIGYLAQDVEKVLPFLVKEDAEGNKVLDYIAFLVAKVDSLEKRISELEKGE